MSRIIETEVFKFEELSDSAKEKARDWYRGVMDSNGFDWSGEVSDTLKAFENEFPARAKDWEYSSHSYDVNSEFTGDETVAELSGVRLRTYLLNNHYDALYGFRVYGGLSSSFLTRDEVTRYRKSSNIKRVSRIIRGETDCPFTGVCYDYSILQPIRDFIKKPDGRTFADLMQDCFDSLFSDAQSEWEASYENENVDEAIVANEYEFTADGGHY